MTSQRSAKLATAGMMIGACVLMALPTSAENEEQNPVESTLVAAARAALEATQARFQVGQASADQIYLWSRRLLEAELASGAGRSVALKHVARMRELSDRAIAAERAGAVGGEPIAVAAARYYLEEANTLAAGAAAP
jgi:hypothetical protein